MNEEQKKITKISGTSEEIREALKGNKVEIGLDIDGRDPKQVDFLREVLNKPSPNDNVDLKEENEDLRNKLAIIAEKRLDEKRKIVTNKINSLIRDPSRRAEMLEKLKTDTPDGVSAMDTTMKILEEQLANKNQRFEPAGSAPMNAQQMGYGQQSTDLMHRKFANIEEAIATLQTERRKGNQEANELLNLLWKKGLGAWREAGHPSQTYSPDSNMEKSNAVPDINFENPKVSRESGFPQIKKSPYNYSKTHNAAGQKRE
ncbi:MAG: hypothetical protein ABSA75_04290 [Candidatus Bathyarchaeia archaeon]|jgi:hypothetical protein